MFKFSKTLLLLCACHVGTWASAAEANNNALQTVAINVALQAGDSPVRCGGEALPLGKAGTPAHLRDARLYVHNVRLLSADGLATALALEQNDWQYLNVALLDFEDGSAPCVGTAATNTVLRGTVPAGEYVGLAFDLGVPVTAVGPTGAEVALNHSSVTTAAAPLDIAAMGWSWQAGRKFIKLEFLPVGGVTRKNDVTSVWTIHLGSTGCVGNHSAPNDYRCNYPNRRSLRFEHFDWRRDVVVFDIGRLMATSDLSKDEGGAAGCMSFPGDPECGPVFQQLGLPLGAAIERSKIYPEAAAFRKVSHE